MPGVFWSSAMLRRGVKRLRNSLFAQDLHFVSLSPNRRSINCVPRQSLGCPLCEPSLEGYCRLLGLVQPPDRIHLALGMGFFGVTLGQESLDFSSPGKFLEQSALVQFIVPKYVRKAATVRQGADLGCFLNQVVADEFEIPRRRRSNDVVLRIAIQTQDVPPGHASKSRQEVIEIVEVIQAVVLADDVVPVFVQSLGDQVRAKQ